MSTRRARPRKQPPPRTRISPWSIVAVAGLAVAAVAALGLLGQTGPGSAPTSVATTANIMGDPAAPVLIEEWGDVQ